MMPETLETAYALYMSKVTHAREMGYSDGAIAEELQREKETIMPRCMVKQAELAQSRSPYPAREAARAARECVSAIDRICRELREKEPSA